jgi:hypothetical protein
VWAPAIDRDGKAPHDFILLYSAKRANSDQVCIGRAVAAQLSGPFRPDRSPLICPKGGVWALDPNTAGVNKDKCLLWRQDTGLHESQLLSAQFNASLTKRVSSPRVMLSSNDVAWEGPYSEPGGNKSIIENPALVLATHTSRWQWYLFFSGNNWASDDYATGWATCELDLLARSKCTPIPSQQPWFGWTGRAFGVPITNLPGDLRGPGGMSLVLNPGGGWPIDNDGNPYVAFHHWVTIPPFYYRARHTAVFKMTFPFGPAVSNFELLASVRRPRSAKGDSGFKGPFGARLT